MAGSNQVNLNESRVTPSSFLSSTSAIRTFPYFPSVPKLLSTIFFFSGTSVLLLALLLMLGCQQKGGLGFGFG